MLTLKAREHASNTNIKGFEATDKWVNGSAGEAVTT
ncbi:hypothetical protein PI125_g25137 [Phytophthora idaei]|nr:hypothetical protein PI125_g25137 [Phytophthora idaei]